MLKINELYQFCEECVTEIDGINDLHIIASDDEFSRKTKDIVNDDQQSSLIMVVPDHDGNFDDEDNRSFRNNIILMVVRKTDSRAGHQHMIDNLVFTQGIIKLIIDRVMSLYLNFGENCIFRNLDIKSFKVDPQLEYHKTDGYRLEFSHISYER